MRGTGCSGGAFDFFEPLQGLDGYDVIETVARQPWVLNGKVGMAGVSYGGISQLFVGETRPPHLAAIAPLSVIDQTQTTLYPGGVLNTGFALQWAMDRVDDSQPAGPDTGQAWAYKRIQEGDEVCKANQDLHPEAVNLLAKIQRNQYYKAKVADPLSPLTFVHKINVPVFMACQWTDEQTGGHCPTLAGAFTGTKHKWFTFTNGVHTDSLDPATFNRWYDFMTLYVAQRKPQLNPAQQAAAPIVYDARSESTGSRCPMTRSSTSRITPRPSRPSRPCPRFGSCSTTAPAARSPATRSPVRALVFQVADPRDEGALVLPRRRRGAVLEGPEGRRQGQVRGQPDGPPADGLQRQHGRWHERPLDGDAPVRLDADPGRDGGELRERPAERQHDCGRRRRADGLGPLAEEARGPAGDRLRGPARRHRDLRAERLGARRPRQARPQEVDEARARPQPKKKDKKGLSPSKWTKVTIPLYYQGHAYRTGSRIRVTVSAVGGDQPVWAFADAKPKPQAKVQIAHTDSMPSKLLLPVVSGVDVPTGLPPCPGLRGEPCRTYQPYANSSSPLG